MFPPKVAQHDAREGKSMLILARKAGEAIAINDNITVTVLEMKGGQVKLGIEAPAMLPSTGKKS